MKDILKQLEDDLKKSGAWKDLERQGWSVFVLNFAAKHIKQAKLEVIESAPCCATRVCFGICKEWKKDQKELINPSIAK